MFNLFPRIQDSNTKGLKVRGEKFKRNLRGNVFVYIWNEMPEEAIVVETIMTFKKHLGASMDGWGGVRLWENADKWDQPRMPI